MAPDDVVCLLQREPQEWMVCFVPSLAQQWWHKYLASKYKHCFALRKERDNVWTLIEPWWSRILIATINDDEARRFIRWAKRGVILKVKEHIPGNSSQIRGWMSCAAIIAHMLGRNYMVYTPNQLLKRLLKEEHDNRQ